MREINVIFDVVKEGRHVWVKGWHYTFDNGGKTIVPALYWGRFPHKPEAEAAARRATINLYDNAEIDNSRFDAIKRYLAKRAGRPPVNANQGELFA